MKKATAVALLMMFSLPSAAMDESEQAMANWLAHPLEFGELPVEINRIHSEITRWPMVDNSNFIEIVDFLHFGQLVFYSAKYKSGNSHKVVSVFENHRLELDADSKYLDLPPLYYFVGKLFYDGNL